MVTMNINSKRQIECVFLKQNSYDIIKNCADNDLIKKSLSALFYLKIAIELTKYFLCDNLTVFFSWRFWLFIKTGVFIRCIQNE